MAPPSTPSVRTMAPEKNTAGPNIEALVQRTPVVVFVWRFADGWPVEYVSDSVRQFGYSPEEFLSGALRYGDLVDPRDIQRLAAETTELDARGDGSYALSYRIRTRSGEVRFIEERSVARRDATGRITHYEGVAVDVTARHQAEQRVEEQLRLLQTLIDAIPMPVYYKDADGRYRGCNRAFTAIAGLSTAEIVDRGVHEVWPKQLADRYHAKDVELLRTPGVQVYEEAVRYGDGSIHHVVLNRATFTDAAGRVAGIVGVLDDASQRKEAMQLLREAREALEARVQERTSELVRVNEDLSRQVAERLRAERRLVESERKYRELANSLPQTVFEADAAGGLTWVNDNAARMFGRSRAELERLGALALVADADRDRAGGSLRRALAGGEVDNQEYLAQRSDGSTFPAIVSLRPIAGEGGVAGVRGLIVDITDRVAVERMKTEFLSVASHELRTPLTPLRLLIQQSRRLLARGERIGDGVLERMERQARRLSDMVNDLLDVTRLERGTLVVRPVPLDLRHAVASVVEDYRHQFSDRTIELAQPGEPVAVEADVTRIEQVVANLIDNALKYAPASPVGVVVREDENWATLSVTDSGPGIDPQAQAGLFTRFYRTGPVTSRTQRGLGLGLYICREIIDRHGGEIAVDSTPGHGTTFHVRLPRRSQPPDA